LRSSGLSVDTEQVDGAPAEVIVQRARDLGAGLIMMTTHGRSGLRRVLLGSVAEAVLHDAPCPVLLVKLTNPRTPAGERPEGGEA
jgi:nucleotide-binding universal stress UspA family protein